MLDSDLVTTPSLNFVLEKLQGIPDHYSVLGQTTTTTFPGNQSCNWINVVACDLPSSAKALNQ
jgi:hypothetical protein